MTRRSFGSALALISTVSWFVAIMAAMATWGCAASEEPGATWVEGAMQANAAADQAISNEDWDGARQSLRGAVDRPVPASVAAEDARVVKQDLLYRLAEVELAAGNVSAAADRADEGLNLGQAEDVFTVNLLVARARAREAQDRPREAAGDYFEALEINQKLLSEALGE